MDQQISERMALIITEVPDTQLFILLAGNRTKLAGGVLKVAQIQESKSYFITVDKFNQNIASGTPFVTITRPQGMTVLFPNLDQGLNGIFIPQSEQFEYFFAQLSTIIQLIPFDEAISIPQFKDTIEMHCKNIIGIPLEDDNNVVNYIAKGGDVLKTSFQWIGGAIATGINKGGEFLNSKVSQGEEVQVSDNTKSKLTCVKDKASQAYEITSAVFFQLYRPVAEKTNQISSDISQKINTSDNKYLQQGKQLTTATWGAAGTALSGLGDALSQVGTSLNQNTRQIVEKKYGQDVTQTFLGTQANGIQQQDEEPQNREVEVPQMEVNSK